MDWNKIWNDIVNFFKTNVWNIVLFFAVLLLGIILVKLIINLIKRVLKKTKMEPITIGFTCGILKVLLYLCLILVLLSIIGIELTGILTAFSALLLAVGLALQNIIANVANGIVVVSSKMFKKGDYIKIGSEEGNVIKINFLFTVILTADNKRITIPNSTIVNGNVIDYDSTKTRRVDIKFDVAYESDVEKVKKIIKDVMYSNGKVLLNPEPFCRLNALNSSSIQFILKCWCDSEDYWDVYYDLMESVYNELKRNNISIPYNQLEIRERKDNVKLPVVGKGLPKRVEKVREEKPNFDLENISFGDIFNKHKKKKLKGKDKIEKKIEGKKAQIKNKKSNLKKNSKIKQGSLKIKK